MSRDKRTVVVYYRSVSHSVGKRPCIQFQGTTIAASIQTYGILIPNICCDYEFKLDNYSGSMYTSIIYLLCVSQHVYVVKVIDRM